MTTPSPCAHGQGRSWRPPVAAWLLASLAITLALAPPPAAAGSEVYFSPGDRVRARLHRQIDGATTSIDLAIYDFTAHELGRALLTARARGVVVRIVADLRKARERQSEIPLLQAAGLDVRLVSGRGRGIMHHKFAVFDGRLVVTGSYNWTESAETANFENALFLDDPALGERYTQAFERLYERAALAPPRTPATTPGALRPASH